MDSVEKTQQSVPSVVLDKKRSTRTSWKLKAFSILLLAGFAAVRTWISRTVDPLGQVLGHVPLIGE